MYTSNYSAHVAIQMQLNINTIYIDYNNNFNLFFF